MRWQILLRDTSVVTYLVFLCRLPFRPWSDFCCISSIVLALSLLQTLIRTDFSTFIYGHTTDGAFLGKSKYE